jgi:hypothetical protein
MKAFGYIITEENRSIFIAGTIGWEGKLYETNCCSLALVFDPRNKNLAEEIASDYNANNKSNRTFDAVPLYIP